MANTTAPAERKRLNYLNADYGVKSWLLTTDHKRIALLYLLSISVFFLLGGLMAVLIRLELATPAGDLVQFTSDRGGDQNYDIYTIDVTTRRTRRLTEHPGVDAHASWSSDGRWLAFSSRTSLSPVSRSSSALIA